MLSPRTSCGVAVAGGFVMLVAVLTWTDFRQHAPYMDELFHIPQARIFCSSVRTMTMPRYLKSITTPPGVYIIPALLSFVLPCTSFVLRFYSTMAALVCMPLLMLIVQTLQQNHKTFRVYPNSLLPAALAIWSHAPLLFYATLFYTDTFSNAFILLSWLLALRRKHVLSAMAAVTASSIRQTNIPWHLFIVLHAILSMPGNSMRNRSFPSKLRKFFSLLLPHSIAGLLYLAFYLYNGGIVIGHREMHDMTLHPAMFVYFLFYRLFFSFPYVLLCNLPDFLNLRLRLALPLLIASSVLCIALVQLTGDHVHPFIVSDNRHFTFYIYRRWLLRGNFHRMVLVPFYSVGLALSFSNAFSSTKQHRSLQTFATSAVSEQVLVLAVTALCVIPSSLLEPRYFITPYMFSMALMLARNSSSSSSGSVQMKRKGQLQIASALTFLFNITVYLALVYVFNELPFKRPLDQHMPLDRSPGRFML